MGFCIHVTSLFDNSDKDAKLGMDGEFKQQYCRCIGIGHAVLYSTGKCTEVYQALQMHAML